VKIKAADEHCQKHNPEHSFNGRVSLRKDSELAVVTPMMARCHLQHQTDELAESPQRDASQLDAHW